MAISRLQWSVMEVGRPAVSNLVARHYLHRWPGVVVSILGLIDKGRCIGCIVFALPPRETSKRYKVAVCWELARLFIEDNTPRNAESWFLSRAVKWVLVNRPEVQAIVSYADPSAGHQGTIYKAANWICDGMTDEGRKTPRCDYRDANTGKLYSRKAHVPDGVKIERVPRVSKFRYVYYLDGTHERRRTPTPSGPEQKGH